MCRAVCFTDQLSLGRIRPPRRLVAHSQVKRGACGQLERLSEGAPAQPGRDADDDGSHTTMEDLKRSGCKVNLQCRTSRGVVDQLIAVWLKENCGLDEEGAFVRR